MGDQKMMAMSSKTEDENREFTECSRIVTCAICLGPFVDGRTLRCSHTFCFPCLRQYQEADPNGNCVCCGIFLKTMQCPTCREYTVPPESELPKLPLNRFANSVAGLVLSHEEEGQGIPKTMQQTVPQQQQQQFNMLQQGPTVSQYQVVWQGSLEFCERRANAINQSDRMLIMHAKLMADANTDSDLISSGGLFKWPQKISIYPIPEVILSQSSECKRQLSSETRRLNVVADNNHGSPCRTFVTMLIEKGMAGVVNMNAQNEYQIMVLFPVKNQSNAASCAMKAFLPRQQASFYEDFKRSVQLYKDKTKQKTAAAAASIRSQLPNQIGMQGHQQGLSQQTQSQQTQMTSRMVNPAGQRPMNPNLPQQVMIGSNTNQQGFPSTGQMNQGGLQQANMQPQGQQMAGMGGQQIVNQQMGGQRPIQNQPMMMRPQMVPQMVQQRQPGQQLQGQQMQGQQIQGQQMQGQQMQGQQMQGQQMQGQQMQGQQMQGQQMQGQQMQGQPMMMQQSNKQPQLMMGGNVQGGVQQGQLMGASSLDDLQGIFNG